MKKNIIRHSFTALGLAILLMGATACGKQADTEENDTSYVAAYFAVPDAVTGISRLLIKDDTAYISCIIFYQKP